MLHTAEITYKTRFIDEAQKQLFHAFWWSNQAVPTQYRSRVNASKLDAQEVTIWAFARQGLTISARKEADRNGNFYGGQLSAIINIERIATGSLDRTDLFSFSSGEWKSFEENFNGIMRELENILSSGSGLPLTMPSFEKWKVKRIDYCMNLKLSNLAMVEQYIAMLKHCDVPSSMIKKHKTRSGAIRYLYHGKSLQERDRDRKYSFYVVGDSVNINIYSKYHELLEGEHAGITDEELKAARPVLRFEIQTKQRKINYVRRISTNPCRSWIPYNRLQAYMSPSLAKSIPREYAKIIDSYGAHEEKQNVLKRIEAAGHRTKETKERLHKAIDEINRKGGSIYRAKQEAGNTKQFRSLLAIMKKEKINPVTIRDRAGIKSVPCLYDLVLEEIDRADRGRL